MRQVFKNEIGKTKDQGFQFGIRRTFALHISDIWDLLFSPEGLKIWLGPFEGELELRNSFRTGAGVEGSVRVLHPYSHCRLDWRKPEWNSFSLVQVRVTENGTRTTIAIHQEKLLDGKQRAEMKTYWTNVMNELTSLMEKIK